MVSHTEIVNPNDSEGQPLLTVPHSLVLNQAAVEEYAKEDRNFKQLVEAVGHHVPNLSSSPLGS